MSASCKTITLISLLCQWSLNLLYTSYCH